VTGDAESESFYARAIAFVGTQPPTANVLAPTADRLDGRRSLLAPWSAGHVAGSLLRSGAGWRDRAWIAAYLLDRRGPRAVRGLLDRPAREGAALGLRELAAPLHVSAETGGLATYYEIVIQRIYAPSRAFEPAPGQTVIDVGANVGVFSLWAASRIGPTGRLVSVEPHPLSYAHLERNLAPFGASARTVQGACGDSADELELHYVPGRLSVSSFEPRPDRTGHVRVPVQRLDQLLSADGIDQIDLLKIDVEGAEEPVIQGAGELLWRVNRLVIEIESERQAWLEGVLARFGLFVVARRTGMWGLASANVAAFERRGT
jgi:FkbM family methyltransferase